MVKIIKIWYYKMMHTEHNNQEFSPPKTIEDLLNLPKEIHMRKADAVFFLEKIHDALLHAGVEMGNEDSEVRPLFNHREIYKKRLSNAHAILGRYIQDNHTLQEYSDALNIVMHHQTGSNPDMRMQVQEKHNYDSSIGMTTSYIQEKIQSIQKGEHHH